jgi:hypothetical protein
MAAVALAGLAACGAGGAGEEGRGGLRLAFEERAEPGVFLREGLGRRDAPEGAGGLWAVVAGLPRPERGLVENLETGARTTVALFTTGRGGGEVRLSAEAAASLGIGDRPVPVRVTALRSEPRIVVPGDR